MTEAASIELKRHYDPLSEKETDAVIEAVADLIVNFVKHRKGAATGHAPDSSTTSERAVRAGGGMDRASGHPDDCRSPSARRS